MNGGFPAAYLAGAGEPILNRFAQSGPEFLSYAFHGGMVPGLLDVGAQAPWAMPGMPMAFHPAPALMMPAHLQAAAARQRASQRQQAKRASRARIVKTEREEDSDGSDSNDDAQDDAQVPDMGANGASTKDMVYLAKLLPLDSGGECARSAGKGGSRSRDNDKEHKRMKRLLRNRVSAQQARERKKHYVAAIETRTQEFKEKCERLEQRIATLERENAVLRSVLKSTTLSNDVGGAPPEFQSDAPAWGASQQVVPDAG